MLFFTFYIFAFHCFDDRFIKQLKLCRKTYDNFQIPSVTTNPSVLYIQYYIVYINVYISGAVSVFKHLQLKAVTLETI